VTFWEYDPTNNVWTRKADLGGEPRYGAFGFSINSVGYIGTGDNSNGYQKDFWNMILYPTSGFEKQILAEVLALYRQVLLLGVRLTWELDMAQILIMMISGNTIPAIVVLLSMLIQRRWLW
jgi:hypothetical protein